MPGTFFARIDALDHQVGHGVLAVNVEVNQVYAKYQELREDLKHPRGGQAHALRDSGPAGPEQDADLEKLAAEVLIDLHGAAIDLAERVCVRYLANAPVEFWNLRRSTHPKATDDGEVFYEREPYVHRLSEAELRAQRAHGYDLDYGAHAKGLPRL
jgi:hypothetical protein